MSSSNCARESKIFSTSISMPYEIKYMSSIQVIDRSVSLLDAISQYADPASLKILSPIERRKEEWVQLVKDAGKKISGRLGA